MACKNRTGEIFIIRESRGGKGTYSCWLICHKFYDTYFKEYVYDVKTLYNQYSTTNNRGETLVSHINTLARRKSTKVFRVEDLWG